MFEDDIKKIDEWFKKHEEGGSYHSEDVYSIDSRDLEKFTDFLREEWPDCNGIPSYIGTGGSAIWFYTRDLEDASFL